MKAIQNLEHNGDCCQDDVGLRREWLDAVVDTAIVGAEESSATVRASGMEVLGDEPQATVAAAVSAGQSGEAVCAVAADYAMCRWLALRDKEEVAHESCMIWEIPGVV